MNLDIVRDLLTAAIRTPGDPFPVSGLAAAHQVELLAKAGFIEAGTENEGGETKTIIKRVTEAGEKLLRVLDEVPSDFKTYAQGPTKNDGAISSETDRPNE